jgi:hypothetical protein
MTFRLQCGMLENMSEFSEDSEQTAKTYSDSTSNPHYPSNDLTPTNHRMSVEVLCRWLLDDRVYTTCNYTAVKDIVLYQSFARLAYLRKMIASTWWHSLTTDRPVPVKHMHTHPRQCRTVENGAISSSSQIPDCCSVIPTWRAILIVITGALNQWNRLALTALHTASIAGYRACHAHRADNWELSCVEFGIDMTFNTFPTKAMLARFQTDGVIKRHV